MMFSEFCETTGLHGWKYLAKVQFSQLCCGNICEISNEILFKIFVKRLACLVRDIWKRTSFGRNFVWLIKEPIMHQISQVRCMSIILREGVLPRCVFKRVCWHQRMSYKPTHKEGTLPSHPIEKSNVVHDALLFHPPP